MSQTVTTVTDLYLELLVVPEKKTPRTVVHKAGRLSPIEYNSQDSTMSPVLPFDITALIIDTVGENKDTYLLKELALVSHSFHQICSKHLFATIDLHDAEPSFHLASSKKGFIKLLKSRPDIVKHIRKLTYKVSHYIINNDHLLSPILLNFLPTYSRLNCLTINASLRDWNTLDSSLTSAFLHLMRLPTINHIELSYIQNFPLSSLTSSVNLHRLGISHLTHFDPRSEDGSFENIQSETAPQIRESHISGSSELLQQNGRPAFNFMALRRLSITFTSCGGKRNIRYLLQNAKLLEKLRLSVDHDLGLVGLLSHNARTLKVLDLTVFLYHSSVPPLAGLCEELEAMAEHNMLEALFLEFAAGSYETEDYIGSAMQEVEKVLVKPGWSALRQVSLKLSLASGRNSEKLFKALHFLPDKYLSHLLKLESVAFNFSAYVEPDQNIF